ncbi:MAG: hypothetical protein KDB08_05380 [Microthrixaceae bacterium]|nr:hypothetical protein [Microthrixaceae bacterium]
MDLRAIPTDELYERALGVAARISEWRPLLAAAVYSWWRPFPVPIYLCHDSDGPSLPSAPATLALAATELAGRSSTDYTGEWLDTTGRSAAYEGPEPYLLSWIVPGKLDRARNHPGLWNRTLPHILTSLEMSQSPRYQPDPELRIRLTVITGAQLLPRKFADRALPIELKTDSWPRETTVSSPGSVAARRELGRRIEQWISAERDSVYFQDLELLNPSPVEALRIGRDIFARFLAAEGVSTGLPWPARARETMTAADATTTRSSKAVRRRANPSVDPGLGDFTRFQILDAIATRRVRLSHQRGPELASLPVVGRLHDEEFYAVPEIVSDLVQQSGLMRGTRLQIARSLAAAGWLNRAADEGWTVGRYVDSKLTRVWSLPITFLGHLVEDEFEEASSFPVRELRSEPLLADEIRAAIRTSLANDRARLGATTEEEQLIDLGRLKGARAYIVPSAVRQLMHGHAGLSPTAHSMGRALGQAGWLELSDGAWTVPRRIDGRLRRVWNLPAAFLA